MAPSGFGVWPGAEGSYPCRTLCIIGRSKSLGAGRALLAGGWHGFLDPGSFVRGVGVASRDQPLGAGRGFLPPYAPECVEVEFSEVHVQDSG